MKLAFKGYDLFSYSVAFKIYRFLAWKIKNMRSLRLTTFVYVVLFLEFSQCRDAEKVAILSNFSKTRSN